VKLGYFVLECAGKFKESKREEMKIKRLVNIFRDDSQFCEGYPYKWFSHIDVRNYCSTNNCIYCSRFLRHIPDSARYNLSLEKVDEALKAYRGFPNHLGIIGEGAVPQERQVLCDKTEKISPSFLKLLKENNCIVGDYKLITEPYSIMYLKEHSNICPRDYRGDKGEIEKSTIKIDWGKYEG